MIGIWRFHLKKNTILPLGRLKFLTNFRLFLTDTFLSALLETFYNAALWIDQHLTLLWVSVLLTMVYFTPEHHAFCVEPLPPVRVCVSGDQGVRQTSSVHCVRVTHEFWVTSQTSTVQGLTACIPVNFEQTIDDSTMKKIEEAEFMWWTQKPNSDLRREWYRTPSVGVFWPPKAMWLEPPSITAE